MTVLMPPEWAPQDWLWIGFPHLAEEWPGWLEPAQKQMADFASAVSESGQAVRLLVRDEANEARARSLVSSKVTLERRVYGDVWLRDTGPLVVKDGPTRIARRFGFNGWGGKYLMPGDMEIGAELARDAGLAVTHTPMILEGGAVDGDGTGLVATTEKLPGLALGLAVLREAGVEIAWMSELSTTQSGTLRTALEQSGLDPRGQDIISLKRDDGDAKAQRLASLAAITCIVAIAGDERPDFDMRYKYLRTPEAGAALDTVIGDGWFLIEPLLGQ